MKKIMSAILLAACCTAMAWGQDVEGFVKTMLQQYPEARLLDIYKSCFQDYMGAEHLVGDTATVKRYLDQELATTAIEDLPAWYCEPCGMNGNYVRVNLRAVIEGRISADELLDAFIASANDPARPTVEQWTKQWHIIAGRIDSMSTTLPHYDQDRQFIEQVLSQGKYAISHSPEYRAAYSPHYRIVKRELLERLRLDF